MLDVSRVSKYYQGHRALANVSFSLSQGELAFLTGHSGAGKSTLLKVIAMIMRHTHGDIQLFRKSITNLSTTEIPKLRRNLGLIFQQPNLLHDRSVFNNVALPLIISGSLYREVCRKVRAALDKVSMLDKEKCLPQHLSYGEQQRVSIARAIVHKPKLLLADEPTGNLDPKLSQEIFKLFIQLNTLGMGAIIATHDYHLFTKFPYRKLVLNHGALQEDSMDYILETQELEHAN